MIYDPEAITGTNDADIAMRDAADAEYVKCAGGCGADIPISDGNRGTDGEYRDPWCQDRNGTV